MAKSEEHEQQQPSTAYIPQPKNLNLSAWPCVAHSIHDSSNVPFGKVAHFDKSLVFLFASHAPGISHCDHQRLHLRSETKRSPRNTKCKRAVSSGTFLQPQVQVSKPRDGAEYSHVHGGHAEI